jgi:hypothetical protein
MTFDSTKEYGNTIEGADYKSGREYIDAIMEDAKKTLPPGTVYSFISWTEGSKRKAGWVYNLQAEREKQKLFNPLNTAELKT